MERLTRFPSRVLPLVYLASSFMFGCALTTENFEPELVSADDACRSDACAQSRTDSAASDSAASDSAPADPRADDDATTSSDGAFGEGASGDIANPILIDSNPGSESGESGQSPVASIDAGLRPADSDASLSGLIGWASVSGLGVETTTGGGSSATVVVETAEDLLDVAARPEPAVIVIRGTLEVPRLELTSDKTLRGFDENATLRGGIAVRGGPDAFVSNVIIQNLNVHAQSSQVEANAIRIEYAHHVWIDHCAVRDAGNGLIDVVHGSDFVTISFTRLFYTDAAPNPDHHSANLIGHDVNNLLEDIGRLNVTFHHNLWGEGVREAALIRFGRVHVFGNQFASPGNESVLLAGALSQLRLENNHFRGVANPHAVVPDSLANLRATGNVYSETSGVREETGLAFEPQYAYELELAETLPAALPAVVGPQ
jgi:pectate lyase